MLLLISLSKLLNLIPNILVIKLIVASVGNLNHTLTLKAKSMIVETGVILKQPPNGLLE